MPKKLTHDDFIKRANAIHNNKFTYISTYVNESTKMQIMCPIHGVFHQAPKNHYYNGCKLCGIESRVQQRRKTLDTFISESNIIHNNKFDYSKTKYTNNHTKVIIICPIHGEFTQKPNDHTFGYGCDKCKNDTLATKYTHTRQQFISKAIDIHSDMYDYSKVKYTKSWIPVTIICKTHGKFHQKPYAHIQGQGCPMCKVSKGEHKIYTHLIYHNISFIREHTFETCRHASLLRFDFYLPSHNICIEFDGVQHFQPTDFSNKKSVDELSTEFSLINTRDKIKTQYCSTHNITLVRIAYWDIDNIPTILNTII